MYICLHYFVFLEYCIVFFSNVSVLTVQVARQETNRSQIPCLACANVSSKSDSNSDLQLCLTAESMILLGSIERTELQAVFDWWLSPERRIYERSQSSPGQASKVSWESFTFVDEGTREDSRDMVRERNQRKTADILLFFSSDATFFYLPQAAPVQEERNGPTASSKSRETSANHTGSGDLTLSPSTQGHKNKSPA